MASRSASLAAHGDAPAPRRRRSARAPRVPLEPVPLGSLTQSGAREGVRCRACGSERVTALAMTLTDGTPVQFQSCHRCEQRTWLGADGSVLPVDRVLDKTRKLR
ncbi:MAG TPA: hypothetical protein VMI11_06160 [Actinomycetes bacterium]|nr:hypothetical protein [Actinomycetes bacterium]